MPIICENYEHLYPRNNYTRYTVYSNSWNNYENICWILLVAQIKATPSECVQLSDSIVVEIPSLIQYAFSSYIRN